MITLFASIVGFISSIFPELLKILRDKIDKKHELSILEMQMELQKSGRKHKLDEISIYADTLESYALYKTYNTGICWIDSLNGTVRPVLAYAFFALYMSIKYFQYQIIGNTAPLIAHIDVLWSVDDQAIFAGIISFYFGQRTISKIRGNK